MDPRDDIRDDPALRLGLGLLVLGLTVVFSNLPSMPIRPGEAILDRLADRLIRQLFAFGYPAQLVSGLWLSYGLVFAPRRGTRAAFAAWVASVCCYLAPVPALQADLALVPALLVGGTAWGLTVRALDRTTRLPLEPPPPPRLLP